MAGYMVTREHEICCGHRVYGHEGKCKNLHGHNYKFELTLLALNLDDLGRVIDFAEVKKRLCEWLEEKWDHKMLLWNKDPVQGMFRTQLHPELIQVDQKSIVSLPCNPTVENLAQYFCEDIAPGLLLGTGVVLSSVRIWETSKCSATYVKERADDSATRNIADKGTTESIVRE